jgi:hypothetical protein
MALDVAPGTMVEVTITRQPRREAAVKTLDRLFRKDIKNKRGIERLAKTRPVRSHIRGGRPWEDRPRFLRPYKIQRGAACRIVATIDVLRDLASLGETVAVKPV